MRMIRFLPLFVELGLTIFCLIDAVQAPDGAVRNLQKSWWILLILFFPIVGPIAWLVAGRPTRETYAPYGTGFPEYQRDRWSAARSGSRGGSRSTAPDDDPEFLRELGRVNSEHESTLKKWENDLARREEELRRRERGQEPEVG
jgi:hypothetical protein